MTARFGAGFLVACGLATLAGCLSDPTEVVIVVDTDLTPFVDFDTINFQLAAANSQFGFQQGAVAFPPALPVTLGVTPQGATAFTVVVTVNQGDQFGQQAVVVTRKVSNVPFVADEMRALFIPLLRLCMCQGTTCVHALDPECRDVTQPVLTEFDEDNIPRLPASAKTPPP